MSALTVDEDVAILTAMRAGDPRAPRALWARFSPLVLAILRRTVGSGPDSEDLAQEVFLTVFRSVPGLRDPTAIRAFIVSITVLRARHERRSLWRARRHFGGSLDAASTTAAASIDTDAREGLLRLAAILRRLESRDRAVFALRTLEGKKLRETASALGVSMPTVKRRLRRVRDRIAWLAERDPALRDYVSCTRFQPSRPLQD